MKAGETFSLSSTGIIKMLDLLLDRSSIKLGLKDLDHRYLYANRELEVSLGVNPGSLIGKTIDSFMPATDAAAIRAKEDSVIATGRPECFTEQLNVGGRELNYTTIRFPSLDESGAIVGTGFVAIDTSNRHDVDADSQAALEKAQKKIVELQQVIEEMQLRSTTDSLTGAWNRLHIEENVHLEIARLERYGYPFSLVFIDLDHFKQVNDTWGHAVGDEVLKEFCHIMQTSRRTNDMLGRWGGEEFILLLPNTGRTSARLVAERIRLAVAQHTFRQVGRVTGSFGVATCRAEDSISELIDRADAALYAAKENGRNCIMSDLVQSNAVDTAKRVGTGFVRLVWQPAYECGNSTIDSQHRSLLEHANHLLEGFLGGQPKVEITQLIDALLVDVIQHFHDEEVLFRAAGFPEADEHFRIHEGLVAKARLLAARFADDQLNLGELFSFLAGEVVVKHMLSDDSKFFSYIEKAA